MTTLTKTEIFRHIRKHRKRVGFYLISSDNYLAPVFLLQNIESYDFLSSLPEENIGAYIDEDNDLIFNVCLL